MSCLLNDPSEFDGGEMEFKMPNRIHPGGLIMEGQKTVMRMKEGCPIVFLPNLEHQVLPVLRGQRDSLVVWFLEK